MEKKKIIILTGPTAVGKTKLSVLLAQKTGGEIISADSMQVYRTMDIGTAKVTVQEMQGVPHFLIDCLEPEEEFNVAVFQKLAREAIDAICQRGHVPVIAGGTAFYIQALLYGIDFTQENHDISYREELYKIGETAEGKNSLYQRLCTEDPEYAAIVHENNVKRVVRALEYRHFTGEKFSSYNEVQRQKEAEYEFCYFVLSDERQRLYDRIDLRVDEMMEKGLLEEVRALCRKGYDRSLTAMQGIGYKELLPFLDGECTLEEAVLAIKQNTRHFAKRQLTWFRREKEVIWIDKKEYSYDDDKIMEVLLKTIEKMENGRHEE